MKYNKIVYISKNLEKEINQYLVETNPDDFLSEDDTIILTAHFENGYEMDIKCCGAQDECAWTEAVLFNKDGCQVSCSDVEDTFVQQWIIEYDGNEYVVDVLVEQDDPEDKGFTQMITSKVALFDTETNTWCGDVGTPVGMVDSETGRMFCTGDVVRVVSMDAESEPVFMGINSPIGVDGINLEVHLIKDFTQVEIEERYNDIVCRCNRELINL